MKHLSVCSLLFKSLVHSENDQLMAMHMPTKILKVALFSRVTVWPGSRTHKNLHSTYCRLDTVLSALYELTHLILITAL